MIGSYIGRSIGEPALSTSLE